jgi:predicted PurR-regulated permease PerM
LDAPVSRPDPTEGEASVIAEQIAIKRDRLLASLTLIAGIGLIFAIPFALRAGAEFFLPVTAALVIAIALVPMLEWFERSGLPSALSALSCVLVFLAVMTFALLSIVIPAIDWVALLPERIGRVREALEPLLNMVQQFERFVDRILNQLPSAGQGGARTVQLETPNSMFDLLTTSAPHAIIQLFFALLVIFFFLSGWTAMRKQTIISRGSFEGALTTARVIQQVVAATSTYLGTITLINVSLGTIMAAILWWMDMDSPLMWGGIVTVLNYIPYLGPIAAALLLALGGLISFPDPWTALLPPVIFIALHTVEANAVTPLVVGKRVRINPLLILIALSFWTWVWGTVGALLAIPLLIIMKTIFASAGTPDIAGFLFEQGTLTHAGEEDDEDEEGASRVAEEPSPSFAVDAPPALP